MKSVKRNAGLWALLPLVALISIFASCDLLVDALFPQDSSSPDPADYNSVLTVSNQGYNDCRLSVNGTEVSWPETGSVSFSTSAHADYTVECLACPTGKTFAYFYVLDKDSGVSQTVATNPIHLSITKTTLEVYVGYAEEGQ